VRIFDPVLLLLCVRRVLAVAVLLISWHLAANSEYTCKRSMSIVYPPSSSAATATRSNLGTPPHLHQRAPATILALAT